MPKTCKAYLQSVIARIEVDNQKVRVLSDRAELAAAATGLNTRTTKVRGFVRNWRPAVDESENYILPGAL
jgi:hypothetical protein